MSFSLKNSVEIFVEKVLLTYLLTYPNWATFPRFPRVGLVMAVFSAFLHLGRSYTMVGSIFHRRRSSVTDSFHDLRGLPLPWQPVTIISLQCFIQLSLLSTWPYHLSQFILSLDSKDWRPDCEYMSCRLTSSSATKYKNLYLSYSNILTILHIMMIRNLFLTIHEEKWHYPRFFHICLIWGGRGRI